MSPVAHRLVSCGGFTLTVTLHYFTWRMSGLSGCLNKSAFSHSSEEIPLYGSVSTIVLPTFTALPRGLALQLPWLTYVTAGWPGPATVVGKCAKLPPASVFCHDSSREAFFNRPLFAPWGRLWRMLTSLWAPWLRDAECMCSPTPPGDSISCPVILSSNRHILFCAFLAKKMNGSGWRSQIEKRCSRSPNNLNLCRELLS